MHPRAQALIDALQLQAHPEGGYSAACLSRRRQRLMAGCAAPRLCFCCLPVLSADGTGWMPMNCGTSMKAHRLSC